MASTRRERLELLLTLLAVLWLAWQGRVLGDADLFRGWDDRYRKDLALSVELEPELGEAGRLRTFCGLFYAYLPDGERGICAEYQRPAGPARWRERLLGKAEAPPPAEPLTEEARGRARQFLQNLEAGRAAWARSFLKPLEAVKRQREDWEETAREGMGSEEDWRGQFDTLLQETQAYREAYQLAVRRDGAYSRPVECAWSFLARRAGDWPALAGLAAIMDGEGDGLPAAAFPARQDWSAEEAKALGCKGPPLAVAREAADLIAMARASTAHAAKARAVLDLLPAARWQLAAWALTGLLVLRLGRRPAVPGRMAFASLLLWSLAAALTRPHWEWLGGGGEIGWLAGGWKAAACLAGAACLALALPWKQPASAAAPASAMAYPGFVLFTGTGWWLLLDLSANGYFDNRFQGLYQQGNLFAAFVLVSLLPLLRLPLARAGLRALGFWPLVAAGRHRRAALAWGLALLGTLGLLTVFATLLASHRQLTSEIFRLTLLVGLPWFLLARADKLASPWLSFSLASQVVRLKLAAPLLLLLLFVAGGLKLTDDNGPLLVLLYFGSIFAGLGVAWPASRRGHWRLGLALGMAAVPAYVWAGSFALLRYGGWFGRRIGGRLEGALNPFAADNDQMAHVLWFQEAAAEAGGFGLGHAPWCGELAGVCRGVPAQIQSDYVYTALAGVFGPWGAGLLLLLFALWLWRLARFHLVCTSGRVEAGEPGQAWLGWMALCWAGLNLTQAAVTVAGNLAWLPLTGVTFPFLSYGAWSLLGNALFLGLALNVTPKAARGAAAIEGRSDGMGSSGPNRHLKCQPAAHRVP